MPPRRSTQGAPLSVPITTFFIAFLVLPSSIVNAIRRQRRLLLSPVIIPTIPDFLFYSIETSMTLTPVVLQATSSANIVPTRKSMDDHSSSSSNSSRTSSNSNSSSSNSSMPQDNNTTSTTTPAAAAAAAGSAVVAGSSSITMPSPNALDGGRRASPTVPAQKLKNLLAALNFEPPVSSVVNENRRTSTRSGSAKSKSARDTSSSKKQPGSPKKCSVDAKTTTKQQGKSLNIAEAAAANTSIATTKLPQNLKQNQAQSHQQRRRIRHRVLHGTVDLEASEDVEIVVYFDARQEEESETSSNDGSMDEHHQTKNIAYRGESVVLDNILLTRGGGGSGGTGADSPYTDHELDQLGLLDDGDESSSSFVQPTTAATNMQQQPTLLPTASPTTSPAFAAAATNKNKNIPQPPPPPPQELPLRFLRAGKGDPVEGIRRYTASLSWRKEHKIDTILRQPEYTFDLIQEHYPAFIHGRGRNGEPCYYEQPPKTNLKALRNGGVTLDDLLHHYALMTEYMWQHVERDDLARSIYIIDLQGIRLGDFVGEVVDFVKKASEVSSQHYPERAGYVFVIHVPAWFKLIWTVVKPWIDAVTLEKIKILRGDDEIKRVLQERIPYDQLPRNYGGAETSPALGESPEMLYLSKWIAHNNEMAKNNGECPNNGSHCPFCSWTPARSY